MLLKLMVIACPLHCVTAGADKQATRGFHPELVWSRIDQPGPALRRVIGGVLAPAMHASSKNTSLAPQHYDALQRLDCLLPQNTWGEEATELLQGIVVCFGG